MPHIQVLRLLLALFYEYTILTVCLECVDTTDAALVQFQELLKVNAASLIYIFYLYRKCYLNVILFTFRWFKDLKKWMKRNILGFFLIWSSQTSIWLLSLFNRPIPFSLSPLILAGPLTLRLLSYLSALFLGAQPLSFFLSLAYIHPHTTIALKNVFDSACHYCNKSYVERLCNIIAVFFFSLSVCLPVFPSDASVER